MHTVGKDKINTGKFAYEVHCGNDLVEFGGNYPTHQEATSAAQISECSLHFKGYKHEGGATQNDYISVEDILAELEL